MSPLVTKTSLGFPKIVSIWLETLYKFDDKNRKLFNILNMENWASKIHSNLKNRETCEKNERGYF